MSDVKKANQGAVSSLADTDMVMCYAGGSYHPISFANLAKLVRGSIQVGGRNLLRQQIGTKAATASVVGGKITATQNADFYLTLAYVDKSLIKAGRTYTLSFDVAGLNDGDHWGMGGSSKAGAFSLEMKNGRNSVTFVMNQAQLSASAGFLMDDITRSFANGFSPITLSNFQLEEGNVATAFKLSPEELVEIARGGNCISFNKLRFKRIEFAGRRRA